MIWVNALSEVGDFLLGVAAVIPAVILAINQTRHPAKKTNSDPQINYLGLALNCSLLSMRVGMKSFMLKHKLSQRLIFIFPSQVLRLRPQIANLVHILQDQRLLAGRGAA